MVVSLKGGIFGHMKLRTEKTLGLALASALGSPLSERDWAFIREENYVAAALDPNEPEGFELCLGALRRERRRRALSDFPIAEGGVGTMRQESAQLFPSKVDSWLEPREVERGRALAQYFSGIAAELSSVRGFRESLSGGSTLSFEQGARLIGSKAPRFMSFFDFESKGIPLLDHDSGFASADGGPPRSWSTGAMVKIKWPGGHFDLPYTKELRDASRDPRTPSLALPGRTPDSPGHISVMHNSVFDELRIASEEVSRHLPWDRGIATWIVLTGEAPEDVVLAWYDKWVSASTHNFAEIHLVIQPWVQQESVRRMYRSIQDRIFAMHGRPPSKRIFQVFEFVERLRARPQRQRQELTWPEYTKEWNMAHPEIAYGDYRNLRRDYLKAHKQVAFPSYHLPASEAQK
jgi:hypothetical protein